MKKTIIGLTGCFLVLLSGCASMSEKFKPQQKANIGIFADQTITMLSEADFGFSRQAALYAREFVDEAAEDVKAVREGRKEAGWFFAEIVDYSLGLVTIVETNSGDAALVAAYHEFMSGFNEEMLVKLELEPDYYTSILDEVKNEEKFLGALRKAQPIINAAGRYMHRVLDQLDVDLEVVVANIDSKIDAEYKDVIWYQEALEEEKYTILRSFGQLYMTYKGDPQAFDNLVKEGSIRRKELLPKGKPKVEDLSAIGQHLGKRLEALHLIEKELVPDWETYRAAHRELDALHEKAISDNKRARLITLVWLRAHQKMASGVSSPAEWFDIKSLPGQLFQMGTKAIF